MENKINRRGFMQIIAGLAIAYPGIKLLPPAAKPRSGYYILNINLEGFQARLEIPMENNDLSWNGFQNLIPPEVNEIYYWARLDGHTIGDVIHQNEPYPYYKQDTDYPFQRSVNFYL